MKSRTYAGVVCKRKLVGGSDREQRMRDTRVLPQCPQGIDAL